MGVSTKATNDGCELWACLVPGNGHALIIALCTSLTITLILRGRISL